MSANSQKRTSGNRPQYPLPHRLPVNVAGLSMLILATIDPKAIFQ